MKNLPYKKIFFNGMISAFIYGVWTYFANNEGAVTSALTQATLSFTLTFFVAFCLELINKNTKSLKLVIMYVFMLLLFLAMTQISIHYVMHTENILKTVTPSLAIGTIYIVLYILHLKKQKMQQKIYQIDAFATKTFEGNPAMVCPL